MRPRLVGISLALLGGIAAANPKPLPRGSGAIPPFQPCFSTSECDGRSACADSSGTGRYECHPVCTADADCASSPIAARKCLAVTDALGTTFSDRACARAPSTLATIVPLSADFPSGLVAGYHAYVRMPDLLRADVTLRAPELRDQLEAQIAAQVNAAIAAKLASLSIPMRDTPRTTVDSVHFRPGSRPSLLATELTGTIYSGNSAVATWRAGVDVEAAAAPAATLAEQELLFTARIVTSTIALQVSMFSATLKDVVQLPPQPARYPLRPLAEKVPGALKSKTVHAIRFLSADDKEIVIEVEVN
ncbi:MAG TPA: hypothetical protein VGM88_04905 [Kofleriaceae bacterium]|jgi:hypothetical protein